MVAALAVVLIAGCVGGGGGAPTVLDPLGLARGATDATLEAGSARFVATVDLATSGSSGLPGLSIAATYDGAYDFAAGIGEDDGVVVVDGMEERVRAITQSNVYFEQPEGDTRWYRVDLSSEINTPVARQDPAQQLALLRGVSEDGLREVGTEDVRGTPTRRLALTIDPQLFAAEESVVVPGSLTAQAAQLEQPIPGEIWVDEDGRVRRFAFALETSGAAVPIPPEIANDPALAERFAEELAGFSSSVEITVEYFDFGVPVDVQLPDPSLVVDGPRPLGLPN